MPTSKRTVDAQLATVAQKLDRIHRMWIRPTSFGADTHGWRLEPCLDEDEVTDFELQHSIRLPEDYRGFITRIGASGAGPHFGILPLEKWSSICNLDALPEDYLSRLSPLVDLNEPTDWLMQLGHGNYLDDENEDWDPFQGALPVCHHGCTYYTVLIVSGPNHGRICHIDQNLTCPEFNRCQTFLEWYETWLDELLGQSLIERLTG